MPRRRPGTVALSSVHGAVRTVSTERGAMPTCPTRVVMWSKTRSSADQSWIFMASGDCVAASSLVRKRSCANFLSSSSPW